MALLLDVTLPNGVSIYYHRISDISKITNVQNVIAITSYMSKQDRELDKEWYDDNKMYTELSKKSANELTSEESYFLENFDPNDHPAIFKTQRTLVVDYDESMTIQDAYAYLKETVLYGAVDD